MAGLVAKVRHVDHGGWIIGAQHQNVAHGNSVQPFSSLQNGQWAKQPCGVQFNTHTHQLGALLQSVHRDVTQCRVTIRLA